ncbi:MAG: glutathione S-transferase family protein [Pseudomonadota bacterium]|nr:glutathione S-transferase family protein [Pseudomonadota bacterium]
MLIYGALLSPFVRKVCIVAAEKGIAWELKLTSPGSSDPDFVAASPFGKIPAIRDGDFTLADSSAIVAYLEAKHPAPPVLPADPQARGKAVWFDEFADTILSASGLKVLFHRLVGPIILKIGGNEAIAAQGEAELPALYSYLEGVCPADAWLAGAEFGLADIAVASVLRTMAYVDQFPPPDRYPAITAWYARVRERPAWQQVAAQEDAPRAR